jgi:hypothetical protein
MLLVTHATRHSRTARPREFARNPVFDDLFGLGAPGGVAGGGRGGSGGARAVGGPFGFQGKALRGVIVCGRVRQRWCRLPN